MVSTSSSAFLQGHVNAKVKLVSQLIRNLLSSKLTWDGVLVYSQCIFSSYLLSCLFSSFKDMCLCWDNYSEAL